MEYESLGNSDTFCGARVDVICLEGLPGAGKTTLWESVRVSFEHDERVVFIDNSTNDMQRSGLIDAGYNGTVESSIFQLTLLNTRMHAVYNAILNGARTIVMETSPLTCMHVFGSIHLSNHNAAAYNLNAACMMETLERMCSRLVFHMIYLDMDLDQALARQETELSRAYLLSIKNHMDVMIEKAGRNVLVAHSKWDSAAPVQASPLVSTRIARMDATLPAEDLHSAVQSIVQSLLTVKRPTGYVDCIPVVTSVGTGSRSPHRRRSPLIPVDCL